MKGFEVLFLFLIRMFFNKRTWLGTTIHHTYHNGTWKQTWNEGSSFSYSILLLHTFISCLHLLHHSTTPLFPLLFFTFFSLTTKATMLKLQITTISLSTFFFLFSIFSFSFLFWLGWCNKIPVKKNLVCVCVFFLLKCLVKLVEYTA